MITALTITLGSSAGDEATLGVAWEGCDAGRHRYRYWVRLPHGDHLCRGQDLHSGVSALIHR